jgi:hypothetical protein
VSSHQVFACQAAVVPGLQQTWPNAHAVTFGVNQFLWCHRVQSGRHDGTRHDAHAFTRAHSALPGGSGQGGADHFEVTCLIGEQLGTPQGKAVHGRVVVRWHADGGDDIARQDAAQGLHEGDGFAGGHGLHQFGQKCVHLLCRQRLRVVALQALGNGLQRGWGGLVHGHIK